MQAAPRPPAAAPCRNADRRSGSACSCTLCSFIRHHQQQRLRCNAEFQRRLRPEDLTVHGDFHTPARAPAQRTNSHAAKSEIPNALGFSELTEHAANGEADQRESADGLDDHRCELAPLYVLGLRESDLLELQRIVADEDTGRLNDLPPA